MKTDRINIRISPETKGKLAAIAESKGITVTALIEDAVMAATAEPVYKLAENVINQISAAIDQLQYNDDLSPDEEQLLDVLNICYDVLAKTNVLKNNPASYLPTPPELNENNDTPTSYKHAITQNGYITHLLKKTGIE